LYHNAWYKKHKIIVFPKVYFIISNVIINYYLLSRYWANVAIPHGTNGMDAVCPFCATPLVGCPGYIRLIFQDNVD